MLKILPITAIREDDKSHLELTTVKLASLSHHGLPVAETLVVIPPSEEIKKLLTEFKIHDLQLFEQKETNFKHSFLEIPPYSELDHKIWKQLLVKWFSQLKSKFYRQGLNHAELGMYEQLICFAQNISVSGKAYINPITHRLNIEAHHGTLTLDQSIQLEELVRRAQRKLYMTYVYHFVVDEGVLKFIRLSPFTQPEELKRTDEIFRQEVETNSSTSKTALKLFVEQSVDSTQADGFIISDEKEDYSQIALTHPTKPVLLVLPNTSLKYLEIFKVARNKQRLLNTQLVLPVVDHLQQIIQIKKELSSQGISRKATLKMWFQIGSPENIINIEDYLKLEFDGVIFDLDKLEGSFLVEEHSSDAAHLTHTLEKLMEPAFRIIHDFKLPILIQGRLSLHDELLTHLIKRGIYGIVVDKEAMSGISDYISLKEKQLLSQFSS